jgi:hypothetical protein
MGDDLREGAREEREQKRQKRANTRREAAVRAIISRDSSRVCRGLANAGVKKQEEKGGRERKKEKETRRAKESASIVWIPAYRNNNSDYSHYPFRTVLVFTCPLLMNECSDPFQSNGDQLGNVVDREDQVPPFNVVGDRLRPRYLSQIDDSLQTLTLPLLDAEAREKKQPGTSFPCVARLHDSSALSLGTGQDRSDNTSLGENLFARLVSSGTDRGRMPFINIRAIPHCPKQARGWERLVLSGHLPKVPPIQPVRCSGPPAPRNSQSTAGQPHLVSCSLFLIGPHALLCLGRKNAGLSQIESFHLLLKGSDRVHQAPAASLEASLETLASAGPACRYGGSWVAAMTALLQNRRAETHSGARSDQSPWSKPTPKKQRASDA